MYWVYNKHLARYFDELAWHIENVYIYNEIIYPPLPSQIALETPKDVGYVYETQTIDGRPRNVES